MQCISSGADQGQTNAATPEHQQKVKATMEQQAKKETPFACNVAAFNEAQKKRWRFLGEQLRAAGQAFQGDHILELPDGYAFRFPGDAAMIQTIAEWITLERRCCPFFTFNLEVQREGGPLWLRLTGREGVKEFIRSDFGIK